MPALATGGWVGPLQVKAALGMTNLRLASTGAAPIQRHTLDYFASLNINILELLGQVRPRPHTSTLCPLCVVLLHSRAHQLLLLYMSHGH